MFRAKLYLDLQTDCILSEVTSRWNTSFTANHEEVLDDEYLNFVIDAEDKVEEFIDAFENSEQVKHVEQIDATHIKLTKRSCGALPIIRRNHGMLQWWDQVSGTQRVFNIIVFRREDLRNIVKELREIGSVQLAQLTPYRASEGLLSDRQAEVINAALDGGYYEWPREKDAESLATELDISHTTFLEHLRKAEQTLLRNILNQNMQDEESRGNKRQVSHEPPIKNTN
ncbi:helix-turn-helix domain-containing protein [Haladaptatus salinisoli]|uniref:helix-turn-helix domain-containing protein n=1 Tax=Haladaptatus salinisoli TaxID=2884876 RepID=UPI001D0A3C39|nr:helix-turn-helix domain-containing protein [Haladaptatus salinisoli]